MSGALDTSDAATDSGSVRTTDHLVVRKGSETASELGLDFSGSGDGGSVVFEAGGGGEGGGEGEEGELSLPREEEVLKARRLFKTYMLGREGVAALRGVSLTVRRGEFVVVLGKSGSGKSTLLHCLGGIDLPTRGDLFLHGLRVDARTADAQLARIRREVLSVVFQSFNLVATMTAVENVELPLVLAGRGSSAARRRRALALLASVGLSERAHHVPSQLSGGEQQRVAIARALANGPKILLLDEPTGDLDGAASAVVMRILTNLEGVTILMVTHDVALRFYANRVVHMLDGKIARLETVPLSQRLRARAQLASHPAVKAMEEALAGREDAAHAAAAPKTPATQLTSAAPPPTSRTIVVRKPLDYDVLRFATTPTRKTLTHNKASP